MYFYKDSIRIGEIPDMKLTSESDIPWNDDKTVVKLNSKPYRYMIQECDEENLTEDSKIHDGVTFIGYDKVIDYIKEKIKSNKKEQAEEGENEWFKKTGKKEGKGIGKTFKSVASRFGFGKKDDGVDITTSEDDAAVMLY